MSESAWSAESAALARLKAFGAGADEDIDLAEAALLFAGFDRPEANLDDYRRGLADLVEDMAAERDRAGSERSQSLAGRAEVLAGVLAKRHGYHGDREVLR